jgi:DNA-binding CsgD family transcriptional regulator
MGTRKCAEGGQAVPTNNSDNSSLQPGIKELAARLELDQLSTQTIDLRLLFTEDITQSGSFDIRSGIWQTTFGRVLQALPIPAMLVDKSHCVLIANQACGRMGGDHEQIQGKPLPPLCRSFSKKVESVLDKVFEDRRPRGFEAPVQIATHKIWGRMTLRSIRIDTERFILVLVEDLTAEKTELLLTKKHQESLRKAHAELEAKVETRTRALSEANLELTREISVRKSTEEALRLLIKGIEQKTRLQQKKASLNLDLCVRPVLNQLQAEEMSETSRLLLQSLENLLSQMYSPFGMKIAKSYSRLTPREIQICDLILSGLTSKQIASILRVTPEAIYSHRVNIRRTLGLDSSQESLVNWLKKRQDEDLDPE